MIHRFPFIAPLDFQRTAAYIRRYETGPAHAADGNRLRQVLADDGGFFLVEVREGEPQTVEAAQSSGRKSASRTALLKKFVARSFGSDADLQAFYRFARNRPIIRRIVRRYRGVRVVGIISLWECLVWAIIGQQVSVASAFSVRSRLARRAEAIVEREGCGWEGFPRPEDVLRLGGKALNECGLTRQKSGYVLEIAEAIRAGELEEDELLGLPRSEIRRRLLSLRGIGPWSAEYAMMRVFADPDACPLEDIGLRNAIGREYGLGRQATLNETRRVTESWIPFRGHATFYLWQTLV